MILFHLKTGKKYYIKDPKDFSTHLGVIKKEYLENAKPGEIIKSHLGEEFVVLKDTFIDLLEFLKRGPQTTHPKDFGLLVSLTGLSSGWKVVEGGAGSGILTSFLANTVKPDGRVYSYEKRGEFYEIAKENLEKTGLIDYVDLKLKDITIGIDEKNVDIVVLDVGDPWRVLEHAYNSLRVGGYLAVFLPNITSVLKLLELNRKFYLLGIYESIVREWIYRKDVLRPRHMQLSHTEFLILFRKIK